MRLGVGEGVGVGVGEKEWKKKIKNFFFFLDLPLVSLALRTGHRRVRRRSGFPTLFVGKCIFPLCIIYYWANDRYVLYSMYLYMYIHTYIDYRAITIHNVTALAYDMMIFNLPSSN